MRWTAPIMLVLTGPFDVVLSESTVVAPDLVVARRSDFTARDLPVAPLLVVEVRSRSTATIDAVVKRELYERAGVPSYWLVIRLDRRSRCWSWSMGVTRRWPAPLPGRRSRSARRRRCG